MQKYLSCPLCGTPEPDLIHEDSVNGSQVYVFQCMSCFKIIKVEDITDDYKELVNEQGKEK